MRALVLGALLPLLLAPSPQAHADDPPEIVALSVVGDGTPTNGASSEGAVSADGSWAVFLSQAPEFSPSAHFVAVLRDVAGRTSSVLPFGVGADTAFSPSISADGSTVAYIEQNIYGYRYLRLLDRATGSSSLLTTLVGQPLEVAVEHLYLSPDGRYLLFAVQRVYDVSGLVSNYSQSVIYDRLQGDYTVVSFNNSQQLSAWYAHPTGISADGRYAYFFSDSPNLPNADSGGFGYRHFRRDTQTETTSQLETPGWWWNVHISDNGRYAAGAASDGIHVVDYTTGQQFVVPLPAGVIGGFCQEGATATWVSNDATRFVISTCQQNPYATGVLWAVDPEHGARRIAGPGVGFVLPANDLTRVAFDALDGVLASDNNGHRDVFLLGLPAPVAYASFVALGDSFSSGEGAFDYDDASLNEDARCHRASTAYGPLLRDDLGLGTFMFRACSGAVTDDFYSARYLTEPEQAHWLGEETALVTLTVGGNDAGFVSILTRCVNGFGNAGAWGCSKDRAVQRLLDQRLEALAGRRAGIMTDEGRPIHPLADLYRWIHANAPNARIFVGAYPNLFGDPKQKWTYEPDNNAPSKLVCTLGSRFPFTYSVDSKDAEWLNKQAGRLNEVIDRQVRAVRAEGVDIEFVPLPDFVGHGLCDTGTPWLNGLVIESDLPQPESVHPTAVGHEEGYLPAFRRRIMG